MFLSSIALCALSVVGQSLTTNLTWHPAEMNDPVIMRMPVQFLAVYVDPNADREVGSAPPPKVDLTAYKIPKNVFKALFAIVDVGQNQTALTMIGASKKTGAFDRVWVDWNLNKKAEDSEMAVLKPDAKYQHVTGPVFTYSKPPISITGKPINVNFILTSNRYLAFLPTGYMTGVVKLNNEEIPVHVVDSNLNGRFNDSQPNLSEDLVIIGNDQVPVSGLIQIDGIHYWRPKIATEGKSIAFVMDEQPLGTVEVIGANITNASVSAQRQSLLVKPKENKITLPPGDYWIYLRLSPLNSDSKWNYSVNLGNLTKIEPNLVKKIDASGSFAATIDVKAQGAKQSFSVGLTKGTLAISGFYDDKGARPPKPKLAIIDPNGTVVKSLDVEYG